MKDEKIAGLVAENRSAFYLFDISILKERVRYLKSRLPSEVSLCYAVKANPFVIGELGDEVDRLEVCSPGEAGICRTLGTNSRNMVISGVYKTPEVIEHMVSDSSFEAVFTAESVGQYELLCRLSESYRRSIRVLLRLTNDSQFGMNECDIERAVDGRNQHPYIHLIGLQFFSGTQKTSLKKLRREIESLDAFLGRLKDERGFEAEELEYGSGFPVSYFVGEQLDEEALFDGFSQLLSEMKCKPKITLELGRSIAASCGQYYTHIVDRKQNKGQNYLLIDGGMHQIAYYGQHMAMKEPCLHVVGKTGCVDGSPWTICGSLCSMNDIIAKQILLPEVEIGDTICFENAGAYCMTEGMALFLSRDLPAIYLLRENGSVLCVRKGLETEKLNTPNYERMI